MTESRATRNSELRTIAKFVFAGLFIGLFTRILLNGLPLTKARGVVEVYPASLVARKAVLEYDVVEFEFEVRNRTHEAISWEAIDGSCGCLEFARRGGGPLKLPLTIGAGDAFPVRLTVKTGGGVGKQQYRLMATGRGPRGAFAAHAQVAINVAAGIRVNPALLRFDARDSSFDKPAQVIVYDNYPANGVEVRSFATTRPDLLEISTEQVSNRPDGIVTSFNGLQARHVLTVTLTEKSKSVVDEAFASVVIQPASSMHPVVEVPVIITPQKPTVRFSPSAVILEKGLAKPESNSVITKSVYCYASGDGDLRIARAIPGVKPTLKRNAESQCWELNLVIDASEMSDQDSQELYLTYSETPGQGYRLPIRMMPDR